MHDHEEGLDAVLAELRRLPDVNGEAKARVLIAVATERERDRRAALHRGTWRTRFAWIGGAGAVAAAALITALSLRPEPTSSSTTVTASSSTLANASGARLASGDAAALDMAAQPVQFVFSAPTAAHVRVVGDFNGWDTARAPMVRDPSSGLWSATVMVRPGRHVYAFVVDDSIWMRDPRAAAAPDPDFGRPESVLLVGRPQNGGIR